MYHDIAVDLSNPAKITIGEDQLTVTAGAWPTFGEPMRLADVTEVLEASDRFVYLDHGGEIVLAEDFIPYGHDGVGQSNELLDLLAWREEESWHIKRLVSDA